MIKRNRIERNMTQRQLGDEANIDAAQIGRFERSEADPTIASLRKIADAFKIECSELLDDIPKAWRKARVMSQCEAFSDDLARITGDTSYLAQRFNHLVRIINREF